MIRIWLAACAELLFVPGRGPEDPMTALPVRSTILTTFCRERTRKMGPLPPPLAIMHDMPRFILSDRARIHSSGGEAYIGDLRVAEYSLHFEIDDVDAGDDEGLIVSLTPKQAVKLAQELTNHLMLCGHEFRIGHPRGEWPSLVHLSRAHTSEE